MRTYPERAIPTARAQRHTVRADSQATDTVLVTGENTDPLTLQGVPDVASPVVVATE